MQRSSFFSFLPPAQTFDSSEAAPLSGQMGDRRFHFALRPLKIRGSSGGVQRENLSERLSASLHINGSLTDKSCDLFLSAGPDVGLTLHSVLWLPDSHPHSTFFFGVSDTAMCTGTQMNLNSEDIMQQFSIFFFSCSRR